MKNKNYDSEFCGSLPLHQINLIQSYGFLLVLEKATLKIIQASENAESLFSRTLKDITGKHLDDFVRKEEVGILREKAVSPVADKIPLSFTLETGAGPLAYIALVHVKEAYIIMEFQEVKENDSFISVFQELKFIMAEINLANTVKEVSEVSLKGLKKLTGFNRVLMYQFDSDWNGSVIAEVRDEGMDEYLGLKFPASDIPRQARALYINNPFRLIPDRDYTPLKLYPVINPLTHTFTDMANCNLRSVAAVHIEYMKNMGIKASMSVRVKRNEQLWGLISFHDREPRYLSYQMCSVLELLSEVISARISSMLNAEEFAFRAGLQDKRNSLIEEVFAKGSLPSGLMDGPVNIMELFEGSGASVIQKGKIYSRGIVPNEEDISELVFWLQSRPGDKVFAETNLSSVYEPAADYAEVASGLIAIPVNAEKGEYMLVFRPQVLQKVNWSGNPDTAISFEQDGKKYHPRNSFRLWQETVKHTSVPWLPEELDVAENIRSFIFEYCARYIHN